MRFGRPVDQLTLVMNAVYRGLNTTQLYRDYFISHETKDPYQPISISWFMSFQGFVSRCSFGVGVGVGSRPGWQIGRSVLYPLR